MGYDAAGAYGTATVENLVRTVAAAGYAASGAYGGAVVTGPITPEERWLRLPAESRTVAVLAEDRLATVAADDRVATVTADDRLMTVEPDDRTADALALGAGLPFIAAAGYAAAAAYGTATVEV